MSVLNAHKLYKGKFTALNASDSVINSEGVPDTPPDPSCQSANSSLAPAKLGCESNLLGENANVMFFSPPIL